jgi:hypothetical protein
MPALRVNIPRTALALAALGTHSELQLNVVETQTCFCLAGNVSIRNSFTYTNYHASYCK